MVTDFLCHGFERSFAMSESIQHACERLEPSHLVHASGILAPRCPPMRFKGIEVGPAHAIGVFPAVSQIQRGKFFLLYPMIHTLFMHLEFIGHLLNGEFSRSLGHRIPPEKRWNP